MKLKQSFEIIFLALGILFTQCKKANTTLTGSASKADFTYVQATPSDTLPFLSKVIFTNVSDESFSYQWNFGDNTAFSSEKNPIHNYLLGGNYNVTLTSVGTNGNNSITKTIGITDACSNDFYSKLTNCNNNEWTWSSDADAIKVLANDGVTVLFAGTAAGCQADDIFKFNVNGIFEYNANGQTFDVQSGYSCQAPKPNAPKFKVISKTGQLPRIILDTLSSGTGKPFIGTTDVIDNNSYTVQNYTVNTMTLRSILTGTGGQFLEIKLKKVVALTINDIKNILTGGNGNSKKWKLDPAPGANAIIVGTEASPNQYFAGGPLDTNCQSDDGFTFTSGNSLIYNANGATFNGGNIAPNYNCGIDRSFTVNYTFGPTTGGVAGIATIQLPSAPPTNFIGTTDVPSENMYRIIEISATKLLLRAGNGSGTVFQFKFIPF
jgi:PKD repeat protein